MLRSRRSDQRSGFSLAELAIVLGVFALVMSSIWAAANIARESVRRQQTKEMVITTVEKIRSFYQGQARIGDSMMPISGSFLVLTDFLIQRGVISRESVRWLNGVQLRVDLPWGMNDPNGVFVFGGTFLVNNNSLGNGNGVDGATDMTSSGQTFRVELRGLSVPACIELATDLSGPGGPPGLLNVVINGAVMPLPLRPLGAAATTAQTQCSVPFDKGAVIDFVYRLRQQQS